MSYNDETPSLDLEKVEPEEVEPVKVEPGPNYTQIQRPTPINKDDTHLKLISESKTQSEIDSKLLSYYKRSQRPPLHNDIEFKDYVIHLNIDRLLKILEKPSKKLRSNQKRAFYSITPFGHTVLHVLAKIVCRNYENNTTIDDAFKRLISWKFMSPSHVDATQQNAFNHLIGYSDHVRPEVTFIYRTLMEMDIYPNPIGDVCHVIFRQNFYSLWSLYYETLSLEETTWLIMNMNDEVYDDIDTVVEKTSFSGYRRKEVEKFLIRVHTFIPDCTNLFYDSYMQYVRSTKNCSGCANMGMIRFHRTVIKNVGATFYCKMLHACGSKSIDNFLFKNSDGLPSIFQESIIGSNFDMTEFILNRYINAGGIPYALRDVLIDQIQTPYNVDQSCAAILIMEQHIDIIEKIVILTSEATVVKCLKSYLRKIVPHIDCTTEPASCAICWESILADEPGLVFPKCGHYPFCETCFAQIEVCPYCHETSAEGNVRDIIRDIDYYTSAKVSKSDIKLYDVSYHTGDYPDPVPEPEPVQKSEHLAVQFLEAFET